MKHIKEIIKEEVFRLLEEYGDEESAIYRYYDIKDKLLGNIFTDFLYHNNQNFTKHVSWTVISFSRFKKIWEDYMKYNFVRDEKGMRMISGIMIRNTIRIEIFTELFGHTSINPSDDYEMWIGDFVDKQLACIFEKYPDLQQLEIPFNNPKAGYVKKTYKSPCHVTIHPYIQEMVEDYTDENPEITEKEIRNKLYEMLSEKFADDYAWDKEEKLGGFISDYGLKPLQKLVKDLMLSNTPEKELVIVDKMLNIIHMRSDIAAWFVEGGSSALSDLSGYVGDEGDSNVSGKAQVYRPL